MGMAMELPAGDGMDTMRRKIGLMTEADLIGQNSG